MARGTGDITTTDEDRFREILEAEAVRGVNINGRRLPFGKHARQTVHFKGHYYPPTEAEVMRVPIDDYLKERAHFG
ncbi:MAG: hypothetical protein ABIH34_07320 [Nanoarchaeota archaeon]